MRDRKECLGKLVERFWSDALLTIPDGFGCKGIISVMCSVQARKRLRRGQNIPRYN
jgi:hypothetical protein